MPTHIQIGDVTPRLQFTADGVQTTFTYPFPIFQNGDLEIYFDDVKKLTGFVILGAGDSAGGTVTFDTAPVASIVVTLTRKIAIKRTSDFQESGEFRSKVINDEMDYLTASLQQLADYQSRSAHMSITDSSNVDTTLPAPIASRILSWNDTATGFVNGPAQGEISNAEAYSVAASASQVASALSELNALSSKDAAAASAVVALAATVGKYDARINLSFADSPYALATLTADTLITVDTSGGSVVINLPTISTELDNRLIGINKAGATHSITINANGTDTIGGVASFSMFDDTEWMDIYLDKANTDWQKGNLSYTSAGTGLEKTGSTIGIKAGGVGLSQLATTGKINDVAFQCGFDGTMTLVNIAVQTCGEMVMARSGSFTGEAGYIDTVATGAAVIVDIEKNGITIYTTKPQFAASTNAITAGVLKTNGIENYISGDRITFKVTQIGSTIAGQGVRFTAKGVLT